MKSVNAAALFLLVQSTFGSAKQNECLGNLFENNYCFIIFAVPFDATSITEFKDHMKLMKGINFTSHHLEQGTDGQSIVQYIM